MLSPHSPRNGENPLPHGHHRHHFQSTVSIQKLHGLNSRIFVFRLTTFCFSLASAIFMGTNYRNSGSLNWYDFDAFRYMSVANVIVTAYLWYEMWVSLWESPGTPPCYRRPTNSGSTSATISLAKVFAYMLMSVESAGAVPVRTMKSADECVAAGVRAFCIQSEITISLG